MCKDPGVFVKQQRSQGGTCCTVWWLQCFRLAFRRWLCKTAAGKKVFSVPQKNLLFLKIFSSFMQWELCPWAVAVGATRQQDTWDKLLQSPAWAPDNHFLCHAEAYKFFLLISLSTILLVINLADWMIYGPCCFPIFFGVAVFKPLELRFCDSKLLINYWGFHCVNRV